MPALSLRLDGYYSRTVSLDLSGEANGSTYDAGTYALTKTIADRIALDITLTDAAKSGAAAVSRTLSSAETLDITLTGGSGSIPGFEVQGLKLLFAPRRGVGRRNCHADRLRSRRGIWKPDRGHRA